MKPPTHKETLSLCDRTTNQTPITAEANQFLLDILELASRAREINLSQSSENRFVTMEISMLCLALNNCGFDALEVLTKTKN